ncbi:hypothetical protein H6P81_009731 [Aristolochia fimbriata]|uniref:Glycoside hydrolase family 13 N-terminal domain-containing protein n=1 Tax=Aristolochia fimbriata TaxID=158543 RepID=A0AAV7EMU0_ARIFI|nr:hypothetical protein H6P81_009731 [Aristolochia fimbriata]
MELARSSSFLLGGRNCSRRGKQHRGNFHFPSIFKQKDTGSNGCTKRAQFGRPIRRYSEYIVEKRSFVVNASDGVQDGGTVVAEKPHSQEFKVFAGTPTPFGATARDGGVNFANRVTEQIRIDSETNKTGSIWHVFLQGDFSDMLYGYKFDGKFSPYEGQYYDSSRILLDPYAKAVVSREEYGALGPEGNCWPQMVGMVPSPDDQSWFFRFDWEGDAPLHNPQKDLIIYEMHVRGFTRHESSHATHPRTYLGVVKKLDHLKGEFNNYSGCGNTFNCNHPVVRQFVVDCLRYWVTEMHVDGFRFDLASIMTQSSRFNSMFFAAVAFFFLHIISLMLVFVEVYGMQLMYTVIQLMVIC